MGEKMEMMEWENSSINARSLLLASIHPFYHPLGGIFDKIHHTEKKLYILVYTERKKSFRRPPPTPNAIWRVGGIFKFIALTYTSHHQRGGCAGW